MVSLTQTCAKSPVVKWARLVDRSHHTTATAGETKFSYRRGIFHHDDSDSKLNNNASWSEVLAVRSELNKVYLQLSSTSNRDPDSVGTPK